MATLIHIRMDEASEAVAAEKERALFARFAELRSVIVALSGGIDSAYLAWAADRVLGERALSVTALSESYSAYDREQVEVFVKATRVRHEYIETHELENPAYRANAADRCYYCKDELFSVLDGLAKERHFAAVAYGVNADDPADFRPGQRAAAEHKVLTPLLDAELHKAEIRLLAKRAGIPCWDRPASACLSSRLPYGTEVTPERLSSGGAWRGCAARTGLPTVPRAAARQAGAGGIGSGRDAAGAGTGNGSRYCAGIETGRVRVCGFRFRGLSAGLTE